MVFSQLAENVLRLRPALVGLSTFIPGLNGLRARVRGTGGSGSARYCYSVWLRHAVLLARFGARLHGASVAELGPGDSLGTGLASLLTGASRYTALDVVKYAYPKTNHSVLDALVELTGARARIPGPDEFPAVEPHLDDYSFPVHLFPDSVLESAADRVQALHAALDGADGPLAYSVPWYTHDSLAPESVDIIISQAVLQSVNDLPGTYEAMYTCLKPGGMMSHSIDFGSLSIASTWDGHRAWGDAWWSIIKGRRPHSLNRLTLSAHLALLNECGFETLHVQRVEDTPSLQRHLLAKRFRSLDDTDLATRVAVIVARKPAGPVPISRRTSSDS